MTMHYRARLGMMAAGTALLVAALTLRLGAGQKDVCFGHELPPFEEVFVKLLRAHIDVTPLDRLQSVSGKLTEDERMAASSYLGEAGHAKVREGLPKDKQEYLARQYPWPVPGGKTFDFAKMFPHILAMDNNNITPELLKAVLERLTPEDIASQSFFLGEDGRATFFGELAPDRLELILNASPDWVFIETGKRKYTGIKTYSAVLFKQERLGAKLQDVETISMKYREKPRGIYMKWTDGPWKGRELVYSELALGTGKVRVRETGVLGIIPVTLPVDSEIAKRGSNHMVTEIGLKNLLDMIEFDFRKADPKHELGRKNYGFVDVDGHRCYQMESILPRDKSKGYYCYRMTHYIDFIRSLEIKAEVYNWDDQLQESYLYTQIQINPGLTDQDFDPANPAYSLK
jgi:hypothetical protein